MRVVAAIQVRMGSSRLPGKMMRQILGKPLLGHLLDRAERSRRLDGLVVAASDRPENDVIEAYCRGRGVACFRGSEDDVLGRMLGALTREGAEVGVEVFGDGPLIDPALVDEMIETFLQDPDRPDFLGNDLKTTYPPGMEVEVFRVEALADAAGRTDDSRLREHGTLFIRQHPELYRLRNMEAPADLARPDLTIEVDTEEDLRVVSAVLEHFRDRPDFTLRDVIAFLDASPAVKTLNQKVPRRWREFRADA